MIDKVPVFIDRINEIGNAHAVQLPHQPFGNFDRHAACGEIDIFIGIIDSRAVHDDHRGIQADLTDLADKESGRMFRNHTDPCAVLVQITQTEEHG